MEARLRVLTALLVVFCVGVANATTPSSTPSRSLLGSQLGYVPQGCPLTVSVSADESDSSWFQDAPEIRGSVTLSNPTSYNVPITSIIVQARSSNGLQYSTLVYCDGNSSPVVPYNPVPYTYGTLTCRYRLVLDRNVFGSYGQSGSRKLLGSGSEQANFFPASSSGSSSSSGGGYGYFPPPNQRPTWTVTAIVTVSYSNSQCLSAPTPVNTDCWWSWLSSWYQKYHHNWSWLFSSGRKLLMRLTGTGAGVDAAAVVVGESVQASSDSSVSRSLLNSHSGQSSNDSGSEHRHRHHHNHRHHMQSGSSESGSYSSGRSLLNTQDSGSEHRHHNHNHRHHMHSGSSESGSYSSGRSLLNTQDSGSEHRHHNHHHNHRHHMNSEHGSGSYSSGSDSGRSLLHFEGSSNSGSERSEHRHHQHHNHNHHISSEHNSGSYGGGFSSGGYDSSGRSLLSTDGTTSGQVVEVGSTVVDSNASAQDIDVDNVITDDN